jgi:valyl-tRNA synthetase
MSTPELSASYEPAKVEPRVYARWEAGGFFHAEPNDDREAFSVVIPPPNVTGSLHVGHALDMTVQDAVVRQARMAGYNAVWIPGTDHAGIATQNVVERQLAAEGSSRHELGRQALIERVWQLKEDSGGLILDQLRRLGCSCDWDREVFTLDAQRSKAVREVFATLYEQGLIYRGHRLINWCPRCQTALSDIEVEHADADGELALLRYPAADGDGDGVVVATTRVETMLGDTAVAVHPDDERYAGLVGTRLRLPLVERDIPIVADERIDPEFGTGALKVTPAHDPNDYEIGITHDLEAVDVMTDEAAISAAGGPYEGLDRFAARERVKTDLDAAGLLVSVEARTHPLGHCSRCDTVVEPRMSEQWFVSVAPLAEKAAAAVRDGRTRFVPESNAKGFLDWLDHLRDWCISRQIWWGHRIPAWYDAEGNVTVRRTDPSEAEVAEHGLTQDPDVLDTWFSSALWPFSALGWPDDTPELAAWYPTSTLITGYDINTFWVSRMLMTGLHFLGEVPFGVVFNHGLVRDKFGRKMSKSFGNSIDPLELIDSYGADAVRFALLRASSPVGADVPLAEEWVEGAGRFTNKLWNAARFVLGELDGAGIEPTASPAPGDVTHLEDRWILSRLEETIRAATAGFAAYDLGRVAREVYQFLWNDYCDWYLELAKLRADGTAAQTLAFVLDRTLRLLHPITPFVTEAVWDALVEPADGDALMMAPWPQADSGHIDRTAETEMAAVQAVVEALRSFRADHDLSPAAQMEVTAVADEETTRVLSAGLDGITRLAGIQQWSFAQKAPQQHPVGKVVAAGAELYVPLAGLIDLAEERARLGRELEHAGAEVARAEGKLANTDFVSKAPAEVVQGERDKLADWQATRDRLQAQLAELGG